MFSLHLSVPVPKKGKGSLFEREQRFNSLNRQASPTALKDRRRSRSFSGQPELQAPDSPKQKSATDMSLTIERSPSFVEAPETTETQHLIFGIKALQHVLRDRPKTIKKNVTSPIPFYSPSFARASSSLKYQEIYRALQEIIEGRWQTGILSEEEGTVSQADKQLYARVCFAPNTRNIERTRSLTHAGRFALADTVQGQNS